MLRKVLFLVFCFVCLVPQAVAEEKMLGPDEWPVTVDAVVTDILSSMNDENKDILQNTPRDDLILFHHGWGTGIRNYYGLWRGNEDLIRDACGGEICHPDDASMVIIERTWKALQ